VRKKIKKNDVPGWLVQIILWAQPCVKSIERYHPNEAGSPTLWRDSVSFRGWAAGCRSGLEALFTNNQVTLTFYFSAKV